MSKGLGSRTFLAIAGVVVLVIVVCLAANWACEQYPVRRVDRVERHLRQRIDHARLLGAPPERVIGFLNVEGLEHHGYEHDSPLDKLDRTVFVEIADVATEYHLLPSFQVARIGWSVEILFRFDAERRLQSYEIERIARPF